MLDIVKMLFFPNLIHGFVELPPRTPLSISVNNDKLIFKILDGNAKGQESQGGL